MSHWFRESFRKVHLLYVSPQWAERRGEAFDAAALAEGYARAGVDCVQLYCKDHHGVCYFPCSLGLAYPRDILGELLPELVAEHEVHAPTLVIVGEVVQLREKLAWFEGQQ